MICIHCTIFIELCQFGNGQRVSETRVLRPHSLKKWRQEIKKFGDILIVNMVEHYNNLTLKTMQMLKYFRNVDNFENGPPKFLVKVDDDVFLNLPFLAHQLLDNSTVIAVGDQHFGPDEKWIFGFLLGTGKQVKFNKWIYSPVLNYVTHCHISTVV